MIALCGHRDRLAKMKENDDPTIGHVSDTALCVAVYRAEESERPDALFKDPLARRLAGERGRSYDSLALPKLFLGSLRGHRLSWHSTV